jgi:hypothetical protein
MRIAAMLAVLTCLAGCAQYDAARNENLAAASRERVAADDAACRPSGAPGTPAYDDCRKRWANQHASETQRQNRLVEQMMRDSPFPRDGR